MHVHYDIGTRPLKDPHEARPVQRKHGPAQRGFCYSVLVREDAKPGIIADLGFNTRGLAMASWLDQNRSVWSRDKFAVEYGGPAVSDDLERYVQVHIKPDKRGLTVGEVLALQWQHTRVGMDPQAPGEAQLGARGRSAMDVAPGGAAVRKALPFSIVLKSTRGRATFNPRASSNVAALTKHFESARVVAFHMDATITGGDTATLSFGVGPTEVCPGNMDKMMELPQCTIYSGSADGSTRGSYDLPDDHGFGTEIRAISVGNPDPKFHWCLESPNPSVAAIRGVITLDLAGTGVPAPFAIAGA